MNLIEKIEEDRCGKCPCHYGGFNGEDWDDGCYINPCYGEKICLKAFLPIWLQRVLLNRHLKKEASSWEKYTVEQLYDENEHLRAENERLKEACKGCPGLTYIMAHSEREESK